MIGILIALLSGALMSVQGVFNTEVTKQTSLWVSSAFVQLTALLVCLVAWLITDRTSFMELAHVEQKYMLLSGVLGAFITITVVKSMDTLGPARAAMLIVVAQLVIAWVIELFGMFGVEKTPFEWRKVAGMVIAVIGVVIFKW
jgi:transporter family-2 protein